MKKKYSEAINVLNGLSSKLKEAADSQYGLLFAFTLLEKAACARKSGDNDGVQKEVAELKEALLNAGKDTSMISRQDADSFSRLLQDKNGSLLEFL